MNLGKKVIYQVYPRSFKDTSGDGIGDLRGIASKASYIKDLGVDMVWLNPFFISPQKDNGYDIADYYHIDEKFGSEEDLDYLIKIFEENGLGLMFDMVFNHTSIEHEWFKRALAGDRYYQDFYYIRDPKEDGSLPTNWESKFTGDAWAPFGNTGKYYLCLYDKTQADLNWHNPNVRKELFKIVNYWIDRGIKGFRFDVLNVIGKDQLLKDSTGNIVEEKALYTDTPIVHKWIRELNQNTFGRHEDIITVGEMSSTNIKNSIMYSNNDNTELSMVFSFHHLKVDYENGDKWTDYAFDFKKLKEILNEWQVGMEDGGGWNALFWNNHDQPRANNRFGDVKNYPYETATMLAQTMHMMRGTPYIYMGEEIGMSDPNYDSIDDYKDIESHNAYKMLIKEGKSSEEAFSIISKKSRDNSRTPMQWDSSENAGFSNINPWLRVNSNYIQINVESALSNKNSVYYYYKELIELRKEKDIISDGSYTPILEDHPRVFAYLRKYKDQVLINLNNFYKEEVEIDLSAILPDYKDFSYLLGNYGNREMKEKIILRAYESISFIKFIKRSND
ncbi:alpha,alpha-phosphotrehalase [Anaerococcus sp.]|uniref:alpha,alpha-phosphotrehalase n=1 Tax=Anaerococcus sp. TaxID=1872515 RepID=UPI002902CCDE|nr:alpha,alpha-phosphotrehalase [Anaerococcus sp.]MDU1829377.1 alpha,alpha-phosphotrehalase [Anaerococcus sp.]MDU1865328.1 alpha,alpha-phosphotrehalase [Anaerococcus sp.]